MRYIKKIIHALTMLLLNNIFVNPVIILLGAEKQLKRLYNPYLSFKPNKNKTLQEIAGFSDRPEINSALTKFHADLKNVVAYNCSSGDNILDIGCGPGLYLKDFVGSYKLFATDINEDMIQLAKQNVPDAIYYHGSFINISLKEKYKVIYCIGVLIFISRSELDLFFKKIHMCLEPGGILFLNYPHAISFWDLLYPNLTYIRYSPAIVEKYASGYLDMVEHKHAIDERKINKYDTSPYKSLNPRVSQTVRNSYLLIAKKANV